MLVFAMLLVSCTTDDVSENSSVSSETENTASSSETESAVIETALSLISEEKYKEAYELLYKNRNDEKAKALLDDFTVVHTNVKSTSYSVYDENHLYITEYNEHGDAVKEYQKSIYAGQNYIYDYRYEYTYDESGKMLTLTRLSDGENYPDKTNTYVYDESGNLIKFIEGSGMMGENGEEYSCYVEYKYDGNNNKIYEALIDYEGNIAYSYTYSYDRNGRLQSTTYYNTGINNYVKEYLYNDAGIVISEIEKHDNYTVTTKYVLNDHGDIIKNTRTTETANGKTEVEQTYEFTYDDAGRVIEKVSHGLEGDVTTENFEYNEQGDIVKAESHSSDNHTEIRETEYVYDENGKITKETSTRTAYSQSEMHTEYDDHGNKIRETVGDRSNNYEYTYDESGRIATMLRHALGLKDQKTEYTYDENGNTVKTVKYNPDSPDIKDVTEHVYDENGNNTKIIESKDNGRYIYTTLLTYDEHGSLLTRRQTDDDGDVLAHVEYTYEYDESYNVIAKTVEYKEINIRTDKYTYKYDDKGNRINTTLYNDDGSEYSSIDVTYDADGRVTERIVSYPDEDKLPNIERYTYDELGNLVSEFRQNEAMNDIEASLYEYSDYVYCYTPSK